MPTGRAAPRESGTEASVMKRKRPKLRIAEAVTREHGAKYAQEWFERSFDTFAMFEVFQATDLMTWPRSRAAQGLFQDIEDAICERIFEAVREAIAEAFERVASEV